MGIRYSGKLTISGLMKSFIQQVVEILPDWTNPTEQAKIQASDRRASHFEFFQLLVHICYSI